MENANGQQDSSIQTDELNNSDQQQNGTVSVDPRAEAMARIEQANAENIEKQNQEYQQSLGEESTPSGRPNETGSGDTPQTYRVKVDGEELEVPVTELVTSYQKSSAADKRLKEASLLLQDLEAREKALMERTTAAGDSFDANATGSGSARSFIDALRVAIIEEDDDAIAEVEKRFFRSDTVDHGTIAENVREVLRQERFSDEYNQARQLLLTEHKDLNENPELAGMVNRYYNEAISAGQFPVAATQDAVAKVRKFVDDLRGTPGGSINRRQENKQSIDTLTTASSRTESSSNMKVETPSDVIADMKRLRGQT